MIDASLFEYDLSFIMPVYNESNTIIYAIKNILSYIEHGNINAEIIIVDDDSRDDTYNKLLQFENSIKIIKNDKNIGYDKSLLKGINNAKGKSIFTLSPDDVLSYELINELIIESNKFDLFLASSVEGNLRYTPVL